MVNLTDEGADAFISDGVRCGCDYVAIQEVSHTLQNAHALSSRGIPYASFTGENSLQGAVTRFYALGLLLQCFICPWIRSIARV
jgi:hypothetical protein